MTSEHACLFRQKKNRRLPYKTPIKREFAFISSFYSLSEKRSAHLSLLGQTRECPLIIVRTVMIVHLSIWKFLFLVLFVFGYSLYSMFHRLSVLFASLFISSKVEHNVLHYTIIAFFLYLSSIYLFKQLILASF